MPTALARKVARTLARQLTHTYTRSTVASGAADPHGNESSEVGTVTSGVPCLYGTQASYVQDGYGQDATGARTIRTPALFVLPSDTLAVGDVVTNILDASGALLLAGPFTVEAVALNAELGLSVLKVATLRQVEGRRME